MNQTRVANQQRIFLQLLDRLRPHWGSDAAFPARLQSELARHRQFGSRDRRLYRELVFTHLRYLPWTEPLVLGDPARGAELVAWLAADLPALHQYRQELLPDWPPCPATVSARQDVIRNRFGEAAAAAPLLPGWFKSHCPAAFEAPNLDALLRRAPLWIRLRAAADEAAVMEDLERLPVAHQRSELVPGAIAVAGEADLTRLESHQQGRFEIQDLGSQMILDAAPVAPGTRWLDACAGAGGKTLQLAGLLGPSGSVDAHDIRPDALEELETRARRAGLIAPSTGSGPRRGAPVQVAAAPEDQYDGVLVDAPCSGSGTWRRAPHLKWSTTAGQIESSARLQLQLLTTFSRSVKPGGLLVYATCSLSQRENEEVIASFLGTHANFASIPPAKTFGFEPGPHGLTILPARHDTDGFFVSTLRAEGLA